MSKYLLEAFSMMAKRLSTHQRIHNGQIVCGSPQIQKFNYLQNELSRFTTKVYGKDLSCFTFANVDETFLRKYLTYIQEQGRQTGCKGNPRLKLAKLRRLCRGNGVKMHIFDNLLSEVPDEKAAATELTHVDIVTIREMNRSLLTAKESFYLDLFLFSFYTGGLTITEMAALRTNSIRNKILFSIRIDSGKSAETPLPDRGQQIIDKYHSNCFGDYLLPIFSRKHLSIVQQEGRISRLGKKINQTLAKICRLQGWDRKITLKMTKRAYIRHMLQMNVSERSISLITGYSVGTVLKNHPDPTKEEMLKVKI